MRIALTVALLSACSPCLPDGAVRAIAGTGSIRWAVGDGGLLLRSDDAGASWRAAAVGAGGDFTAVHFESDTTGHIFGGVPVPGHPGGATAAVILRTEDGGATWKPLSAVPPAHLHGGWMHGLRGMAFGRPSAREPAGLWATVTSGRQWIPLKAAGAGALLGGAAADAANACMVGSAHRIVHLHRLEELTTGEAPLESGAALTAVAMAGVNAIWAAGENGSALRYSGPSAGWRVLPLPLPAGTRRLADLEAVAAGGEGEALLAGGLAGAIFHSDDAGRSLRRHRAPGPGPIHALHRDSDGVLLAGGDGGRIFRSTDAGRNWQRVHGAESMDVLLIAAAADVTSLAALAAHAAAGLSTAVLVPALPVGPHGLRGDVPLASAAAALGAEGGYVLTDFISVAGDPAADRLTEEQILQRWSASLDVPAGAEMRRQIAAAVRLYRPAVVVLGPDGYERRGPAAECRLISRIAAEAVELAADAGALPELAEAGLKPWRVRRTFTGLEENARYTPPWEKPPDRPRQNVAAAFIGWRYPVGGSTSLSMTADAAGWRLPWIDPADRAARVTAFRCSEVLTQPVALFTVGLSPKPLRLQSDPPVGDAIASGSLLRGAGLVGRNVAVAAGPLVAA
ncbi:MAG TPA: hypothetical protein VFJ30_10300, partial [Phycisphaerae bacterium]|nr:hypothetical protein [Phycisphaerae bacterium]